MEFFFLNVLLKVFLFLKLYDLDQVELEAMVLDYPKFYNLNLKPPNPETNALPLDNWPVPAAAY